MNELSREKGCQIEVESVCRLLSVPEFTLPKDKSTRQ